MHKNMSLAIGRANGLSSVGGVETINLPSMENQYESDNYNKSQDA